MITGRRHLASCAARAPTTYRTLSVGPRQYVQEAKTTATIVCPSQQKYKYNDSNNSKRKVLMRAAAGLCAGSVLLSEAAKDEDDAFEPGQAIGGSLKGEFWKAKHKNVAVLECADGSPVLLLLSHVRNAATTGADFVSYTDRLLRVLLEAAAMELPCDEEAEFDIPTGVRMQGTLLEEKTSVVAVCLVEGSQAISSPLSLWRSAVELTFPGTSMGYVGVKDFTNVSAVKLPEGVGDASNVLLLGSEITGSEPVLAAIGKLMDEDVSADNIILVCAAISKEAVEAIVKAHPDLKILTGAIDPIIDAEQRLVPGIGGLHSRYIEAMATRRPNANTGGRRRWFYFF